MARRKHTNVDTDYKVVGDGTQVRDGWRTPQPVLDSARKLMGGQIKYDPATDQHNPTRAATYTHFFTVGGRAVTATVGPEVVLPYEDVWLNPPFSTRNRWVAWFLTSVASGILLVANETKPAWDLASQHHWIAIRPRARIAFDLPPGLDLPNNKRPGGPSILFAKGYEYEAVVAAFPFEATQRPKVEGHPGFTVWRCI